MNYLQLVQRLRQETNYANTGPVAVTGQTGDHARAVSWIADAYTELQNRHPWRWLREGFTLTTVSGDGEYAASDAISDSSTTSISRFSAWHADDAFNPPKCYLQSAGEGAAYWLTYIPWEQYRTIYDIGTYSDASPSHITVDPDDNLVLGPAPDDTYVIKGEYHRSPQTLSANADTPEMPSQFHMIIVYLAMEDAGFFDAADDIIMRGRRKCRRLLRQLEINQGPVLRMAGPLA